MISDQEEVTIQVFTHGNPSLNFPNPDLGWPTGRQRTEQPIPTAGPAIILGLLPSTVARDTMLGLIRPRIAIVRSTAAAEP